MRDVSAEILGNGAVALWGLSGAERLRRQLQRIGIDPARPAAAGRVLLLRADYVYDERILRALCEPGERILIDADGVAAAACVDAKTANAVRALLVEGGPAAGVAVERVGVERLPVPAVTALRKRATPYLIRVREDNRRAVERRLYGAAYKGVTDFVTKWLWPRPAEWLTRACAHAGIAPNAVTLASIALVVLATVWFWRGAFGLGLAAAWLMALLDTVDGKLARVTVRSSALGNVLDHGTDLIHPPFWYAAWAFGLAHTATPLPEGALPWVLWAVVGGYVLGRILEGVFLFALADFEVFVWRPFDSVFRLVIARRNPNLVLLTLGTVMGRPDLGLLAVAVWTVLSDAILAARIGWAAWAKWRGGRLRPWLETDLESAPSWLRGWFVSM